MEITRIIQSAFPKISDAPEISDEFITRNQNLMELDEVSDYLKVVPAYMLWCVKYKDDELVDEYTISSLAEYGKTKSKGNAYLNFMYLCNNEQKVAVIKFLEWCINEISTIDTAQVQRVIKNWSH